MTTLAVDFGGRRIKLGIVCDGAVIAQDVLPAHADQPLVSRLAAVAGALKQLCEREAVAVGGCAGIGISYPSVIDTASARICDHFGKFGDASAFDLRGWARQTFGLPLAIDNDARMALIGEWRHGAGRGCDNLVILTLGTGLGVSAVIEGRVLRGVHGQAGILAGHLTLRHGGQPCVCGNIGCAEVEASTSVLERLAKEHPAFPTSALAKELVLDYAAVFRLAAKGDACARALQEHSLQVWSALAVNLIHAYDPERLILAGGVMGSADIIVPAVREYVARHAHTPWGRVQVVASELGDRAALLACEWLVREHLSQGAGTGARPSNYDKFPVVALPGSDGTCVTGWDRIAERLREAIEQRAASKTVLAVECYPGVREEDILGELRRRLSPAVIVRARGALLRPAQIDALVEPFLGGEDPVFGFLSDLTMAEFHDPEKLAQLRREVEREPAGLVLVVGCGARLVADGDILVYADLARWEAQRRFRLSEAGNLGADNHALAASVKYKRAFFVDWRVGDRWKQPLIARWDFVLDTNQPCEPKLAEGEAVRRALRHAVTRPFRVVPFFDPAPWGGQWMKEVCDLDRAAPNYGWCFDCVPEENSLLLGLGGTRVEIPAMDLVMDQPQALLGEAVFARFGAEFPIRFDMLDTMGGGNLSFQVHPLTEYIQKKFGMPYTQDESYYLLDAGDDAHVYLGLWDDVDRAAMLRDLEAAQAGGASFDADRHALRWPARKHDHFLIPAGTVHCSGKISMVLEISATPYIFTFKLWDWGRLGLDGKPRPIHLEHGAANIQWNRTAEWTRQNLIHRVEPLGQGDGWREERTGLHELEFIETRRHWFTKAVPHDTRGGVNVLNLVEGEEAIVESPTGAFEPVVIHYAETIIVPAAVGAYTVRPADGTSGRELATLKAFIRGSN